MVLQSPNSGFRVGEYRNVLFDVIGGKVGEAELELLFGRLEAMIKAQPGKKLVLFNIVEAKAPIPDPAFRKVIGEKLRLVKERIALGNVLVIEAKGFAAVSVRAVIAGLSFFSGDSIRAYGSVEEAADALASEFAAGAGRAEYAKGLCAAVAAARAALAAA